MVVPTNHYAAGVIARRTKRGIKFLVLDTEILRGPNAGRRLTQFAGGMSEIQDNGNPEKTLYEEIQEETGLIIRRGAHVEEILHQDLDGHHRFFFLVWKRDCDGVRRTEVINDTRKKLYVPRWESLEVLQQIICDSHRPVLEHLPRH